MTKYEYAVIMSNDVTNQAERIKLPVGSRPQQTWETKVYVSLPGAGQALQESSSWLDVANRLGEDGWELVAAHPYSSTILSDWNGSPNASYPVATKYILRREKS